MSNFYDSFDAKSELAALKAQSDEIRKRSYSVRKSKLDKYEFQLLTLYREGATIAELQRWLLKNKRCKVVHSTVLRWLKKHGEVC